MVTITLSNPVLHVFHSKWRIIHNLCVSYLELGPVIIALRKWWIYYFSLKVSTVTHTEIAHAGFYSWASSFQNFIYWYRCLSFLTAIKSQIYRLQSLEVSSFCVHFLLFLSPTPPPPPPSLGFHEARRGGARPRCHPGPLLRSGPLGGATSGSAPATSSQLLWRDACEPATSGAQQPDEPPVPCCYCRRRGCSGAGGF